MLIVKVDVKTKLAKNIFIMSELHICGIPAISQMDGFELLQNQVGFRVMNEPLCFGLLRHERGRMTDPWCKNYYELEKILWEYQ